MAEWALLPLSVAIGVDAYIVVAHASPLQVGVAFDDTTEGVLKFGTGSLLSAMGALAVGLALDLYVVVNKVLETPSHAVAASGAAMALMIVLWFGWPMLRRMVVRPDRMGEVA